MPRASLLLTILVLILSLRPSSAYHPDEPDFEPITAGGDPSFDSFLSPRTLAASAPIRITVDYSGLTGTTAAKEKYIQQLMNATVNFYTAALSVTPLSILKIPGTVSSACGQAIPTKYRTGIDSDIVIFTSGSNVESSYLAFGSACVLSTSNGRPYVGHIKFNYNAMTPGDNFTFENDLIVTMHEMVHVLGFLPNMYKNFPGAQVLTKNVNGVSIEILQVEPLTTKLRNYFNCPTLEGAYLENQGSSASANKHFERRVFGNELMTSSTSKDARISEFTFALLESSGWYTANYSYADPFFWGQGKGCNFLDTKCVNSQFETNREEYCNPLGHGGCQYHRRFAGYCGTVNTKTNKALLSAFNYWKNDTIIQDLFADNCPYIEAYSNRDCQNAADQSTSILAGETYGPGSMCFTGTLSGTQIPRRLSGFCFQYQCIEQSNGSFQLKVDMGSSTAICKAAGNISVSGYHGDIECPDPNAFCKGVGKKYCKRGCMGKGVCNYTTGVCTCDKGWGSTDCSMPVA